MKAYVLTTGTVFVLILVAHGARVAAEGPWLLREPTFLATSAIAAGLAGWAWGVFRRLSRPTGKD